LVSKRSVIYSKIQEKQNIKKILAIRSIFENYSKSFRSNNYEKTESIKKKTQKHKKEKKFK
jgi:hypothetical protein